MAIYYQNLPLFKTEDTQELLDIAEKVSLLIKNEFQEMPQFGYHWSHVSPDVILKQGLVPKGSKGFTIGSGIASHEDVYGEPVVFLSKKPEGRYSLKDKGGYLYKVDLSKYQHKVKPDVFSLIDHPHHGQFSENSVWFDDDSKALDFLDPEVHFHQFLDPKDQNFSGYFRNMNPFVVLGKIHPSHIELVHPK